MNNLTVGIIGLGLIGGSLAKSLHLYMEGVKLIAYDQSKESLKSAITDGVIHQGTSKIDHHFSQCDVIFLCLPVKANIHVMEQLRAFASPQCILTDVGSTKNDIVSWIEKHPLPCTFIGGHPMTGSERSGYEASQSYLFENAYYILCPTAHATDVQISLLKELIEKIGGLPIVLDSILHDQITACISHVPHILASLLVNTVKKLDSDKKHMHLLAAGGFKDITRIASASPEMWQHISLSNSVEIIKILTYLENELGLLRQELEGEKGPKIYDFFLEAKQYRDSFEDRGLNPMLTTYELKLDVEDRPGIIATVATLLSKHRINIKNIGILNNREHQEGILEISFYDEESYLRSSKLLKAHSYTVYL